MVKNSIILILVMLSLNVMAQHHMMHALTKTSSSFACGGQTGTVALKTSLLFCWELEETSGTTINDAHTSGNTGISSAVTLNQTGNGNLGKAYSFNGSTSIAVSANALSYTTFSVSIWYYLPSSSTNGTYDRLYSMSNDAFEIGCSSTGSLVIYPGGGSWLTTGVTLTTGAWNHVVLAKNSTCYALYVNNVLKYAYADARTISSGSTPGFGNRVLSEAEGVDGLVSQIAYWNKELNASEVSSLYGSGSGKAYTTW